MKCGQSFRCAALGGRTAPLRSAPCGFTEQALCLAPKPRAPAALRPAGQGPVCVASWCSPQRAVRRYAHGEGEAPARPGQSAGAGSRRCASLLARPVCLSSRPPPRGLPESERRKGNVKGKPTRPLRGRGLLEQAPHTRIATCHRPESEYPCASWPGSARRSPIHAPHRPMHISKIAGLHAVQAEDSPCTARASVSLGGRQG